MFFYQACGVSLSFGLLLHGLVSCGHAGIIHLAKQQAEVWRSILENKVCPRECKPFYVITPILLSDLLENRFTGIVKKKVFFFSIAETFQIVCSTLVSETQGCLWKLLWRLERRPVSQSLNSNPAESDRQERPKGSLVQLLRCTIKLYQSFYWHSFHCLLLNLFHLTKLLFPGRS